MKKHKSTQQFSINFKENPVLDGVCAVKLYDLVKLEGKTPKGFSVKLRIDEINKFLNLYLLFQKHLQL